MQAREKSLRGKESVGDNPDNEGGNHGANRGAAIGKTHLASYKTKLCCGVCAHGHVPRSPHKVVQKHHDPKAAEEDETHRKLRLKIS
jgi:hypothetical protein